MMFLLEKLLCFLILVVPILISVAYLTLAERKIMGSMQQRKGPNVIGFLCLFQPLADGLKLLIRNNCKAIIQPKGSINDYKILDYANLKNTPLYFSKYRFFKH